MNFASLRGRVARPVGGTQSSADVTFEQVGPGRYEAEVDAQDPGLHLVSIRYEAPGSNGTKISGAVRAAIERRAGNELLRPLPNAELLRDVSSATHGLVLAAGPAGTDLWSRESVKMPETARPIWSHLALALAALFLADVAVRRIWIDADTLVRSVRKLFGKAPPAASGALSTLSATKARAAAAMPKAETTTPLPPLATSGEPAELKLDLEAPKPVVQSQRKPAEPPAAGDMMSRLRGAKNRARDDADSQ